MSSYFPPTENINVFNSSLFVQNDTSTSLTQTQADQLYLSKVNTAVSIAPQTTFNGGVNINGNAVVGTNGSSNRLSINGELRLDDTASPYTSYGKISNLLVTAVPSVVYESPNVANSSHVFKCYNSGSVLTSALFDITSTNNISRQNLTLLNRLNFSSFTPYSFPFSSNTSLGYYLKTTGTGTAVTTATPKSIVTIASVAIGVWRIDFSVQNVVGTAGAGTITQAQSYISTTLDGAIGTAVAFTGSVIRSHISEVYANDDIQVITSSFTYNQSAAGALNLNIVRTFVTGTYSFTGEVSITRIC